MMTDPYQACVSYAAGQVDEDTLFDYLENYQYRPWQPTDGYDWMSGDPGEFNETVGRAFSEGLISESFYTRLLDRETTR